MLPDSNGDWKSVRSHQGWKVDLRDCYPAVLPVPLLPLPVPVVAGEPVAGEPVADKGGDQRQQVRTFQ